MAGDFKEGHVVNILISGASRGIGLQLLEKALVKGHTVTALVRDA